MKWRQCRKGSTWNRYDAWVGRKNGWTIEVSSAGPMHPKGSYYFVAHHIKEGAAYNSLWNDNPYESVEVAQNSAEQWVITNGKR